MLIERTFFKKAGKLYLACNVHKAFFNSADHLVRESAVGLIMWLRPKGLKVFSYLKEYAEFKNQSLIKIHWYTHCLCANSPRASSRFNHVVEEQKVWRCKIKSMLNSKIKVL